MPNEMLVDTGFLYALLDKDDRFHSAVKAVRIFEAGTALVPDVALMEATYLALGEGGTYAVITFLRVFEQHNFQLQPIIHADVTRAREIMETYRTAELDFVDCCVMALSERLNIRRVCTIDPVDFHIFRPRHCDYLELLPQQL
jgi:uncharacterized protein